MTILSNVRLWRNGQVVTESCTATVDESVVGARPPASECDPASECSAPLNAMTACSLYSTLTGYANACPSDASTHVSQVIDLFTAGQECEVATSFFQTSPLTVCSSDNQTAIQNFCTALTASPPPPPVASPPPPPPPVDCPKPEPCEIAANLFGGQTVFGAGAFGCNTDNHTAIQAFCNAVAISPPPPPVASPPVAAPVDCPTPLTNATACFLYQNTTTGHNSLSVYANACIKHVRFGETEETLNYNRIVPQVIELLGPAEECRVAESLFNGKTSFSGTDCGTNEATMQTFANAVANPMAAICCSRSGASECKSAAFTGSVSQVDADGKLGVSVNVLSDIPLMELCEAICVGQTTDSSWQSC